MTSSGERGGGWVHVEAWSRTSRGGSSDGRNAREGGRGGRGVRRVRREGAGMNEGWKRTPWESRGQLHCSTQRARQQISRLTLKSKSCAVVRAGNLLDVFHDLISLVIAEKMILLWAKETQMLAILWSKGPFYLLSMRASDHFGCAENCLLLWE